MGHGHDETHGNPDWHRGGGRAAGACQSTHSASSAAPAATKTAAPVTSAPASTSAPEQIDPNEQQCATLDSLGYCPSDDPSPSPASPSCGDLVKAWLAEPDGSGITANTVQHDITAIIFDAKSYQQFAPSDPGAGQTFLSFFEHLRDEPDLHLDAERPADLRGPAGPVGGDTLTSGTFLGDASNAADDTSGTGQAASDVQAILSDYSGERRAGAELRRQGEGLRGHAIGPDIFLDSACGSTSVRRSRELSISIDQPELFSLRSPRPVLRHEVIERLAECFRILRHAALREP